MGLFYAERLCHRRDRRTRCHTWMAALNCSRCASALARKLASCPVRVVYLYGTAAAQHE